MDTYIQKINLTFLIDVTCVLVQGHMLKESNVTVSETREKNKGGNYGSKRKNNK